MAVVSEAEHSVPNRNNGGAAIRLYGRFLMDSAALCLHFIICLTVDFI
jgi:hypothetical protein